MAMINDLSWESVENLFANRNFQNLLSGMGTGFSMGKPAGEAIGVPTREMSRNIAAQEATAKQQKYMTDLIKAFQNASNVTGIKTGAGGGTTLELAPPGQGEEITGTETSGPVFERTPSEAGRSSLLPFWQALLG